jgi:WD40 repeat protein
MADNQIETIVRSLDDAVKAFALSPCGDYLAILNGKGDLLIYRLVSDKGPLGRAYNGSNLVFHQNVLSKAQSRNFLEGYRLSWRPSASSASPPQLCIPQHDGFPLVFSRQPTADQHDPTSSASSSSSSTTTINSKETWTSDLILTSDAYETTLSHCRHAVNLVAFSPNGKYLASADSTSKILIWDLPTRDAIMAYQCQDTAGIQQELLDLQWGPCEGDNYLIVLSREGTAKIDNVINTSLGHPLPTGEYVTVTPTPPPQPVITKSSSTLASRVSTEPTLPSASSASALKRIKKSSEARERDEEEDFDFSDKTLVAPTTMTESSSRPTLTSTVAKGSVIQDDDDEDQLPSDDGDLSDDHLEGVDLVDDFLVEDHQHQVTNSRRSRSGAVTSSNQFIQPPFQPSSTTYDEKRRRYLVWNAVGSMVSRDEDIGNRIEIKFADTSHNKNESFNDNYGFELGALSTQGAFFATVPEDQIHLPPSHQFDHLAEDDPTSSSSSSKRGGGGSVIFYKAFSTKIESGSYPNETFLYTLQYREIALCVTASVGWVALVSRFNSLHYLRVLTTAGMQLHLSVLKGSVVCLCSHLSYLTVAYNTPGATQDSPALLLDSYHITPVTRSCPSTSSSGSVTIRPLPNITSTLSQCLLPLTSHTSLQWLSYSNNGQLVSLDTAGQLLMLFTLASSASSATASHWLPVLDLNRYKKNVDYTLWPVTVKGDKLCYILLNGEKKPAHHPQPLVTAKPFHVPVLENTSATGGTAASAASQKDKDGITLTERYREYLWHTSLLTHHQHTLEQHLSSGYPLPEITSYTSSSNKESRTHLLDDEVSENLIGLDKLLLKLLYEYCKKQKISLALDVIGRMTTTEALESAIKVANHFSKSSLAVIVSEILNERRRLEEEEQEEQHQPQRGLDGEFEREIRPQAPSSASAAGAGGGLRTGIASFKSSRQQPHLVEEDEAQQLAQDSYHGAQSHYSTQSYEYDFSQQEESNGTHPHTPEKTSKTSHSILANKKPVGGPLFSSTRTEDSLESKKSIPVNK